MNQDVGLSLNKECGEKKKNGIVVTRRKQSLNQRGLCFFPQRWDTFYIKTEELSPVMVDSLLDGKSVLTLSHCASSGSINNEEERFRVYAADFYLSASLFCTFCLMIKVNLV